MRKFVVLRAISKSTKLKKKNSKKHDFACKKFSKKHEFEWEFFCKKHDFEWKFFLRVRFEINSLHCVRF